MASYCFVFKSKVMKTLYLLFAVFCISTSVFAQFQWEHTGGPEGFSTAEMYYNKDFAFLYDNFQLYRTGDGQSWTAINTAISSKVNVTDNIISIYSEQYKGAHNPKEIQFILSVDNGDTWYTALIPEEAYFNTNLTMLCSHGIYFNAGGKLYRSQNIGQSWKQVSYDGIEFDSLFSSTDKIFGRNKGKIYEFNHQSGKWIYSWKVPPTSNFESIFIKGNNIIIQTGNRFYSSQNKGEIWKINHISSNDPKYLIEKNNKVYSLGGNVMRYTEDGGQSWNTFSLDQPYQTYCLFEDKFLLFSSLVGCVLFDDKSNSYLPANEGLNSSEILYLWGAQNQIWAQLFSNDNIYKFDVSSGLWNYSGLPKGDSFNPTFFISSSGNLLYQPKSGNIQISADMGISWSTLNLPYNHHSDVSNFFWIEELIYIQGEFNQFISTDLGITWAPIIKRLKSAVIFRDKIWAGDDAGKLVVSDNLGLSWNDVDTEIQGVISLLTVEERIFVVNSAGHLALFSSTDGLSWEYSSDGLLLVGPSTGRFSERKVWKQNDIYFFQGAFSRLFYSVDNCSSWELVLPDDSNSDIVVLNDTLYFGSRHGGGVIKSKMPSFNRPFAKGSIFHDLNGDGIKDADENYMNDIQIMLSTAADPQKNYFTLSNEDGQFEIRPSIENRDKLWPNVLSEYVESIEPPFYITHDSIDNYDFAVRFRPDVTDATISGKFNILPEAGKELTAHIAYQNKGTVPMSGSVGLKLDSEFTFINSSPPPSEIVNADSIVWHFEDLPASAKNQILVEGRLSSNLQDGALISLEANILPSTADVEMADNHFLIQDSIVSTFVPNQKSVYPAEGMTVEDMLEGKELEYTIRFQNPFNHVVNSAQISDALATNLDYNSIRITGSSHEITKWELLPAGILRVFFDNMNLAPNSMEDQRSQGFLSFAIRIRKDNNPNFNFTNKANIIFEKTRTVTTNTVNTKMIEDVISSTEEFIAESHPKLSITPNPVSNACTLSTNGNLKGSGIVRIFHPNGQMLYTQKVLDLNSEIALQTDLLLNGFYLITAEGAEGIMHGKLIIQK